MLYYYNPLIEDGIFYSCDSLRFSFVFSDVDMVEDFFAFLSHLPGSTHYQSLKDFDYRYLYVFGIKGLSFSIGCCMNGIKRETVLQGFLDFNPNKILGDISYGNGFMGTVHSPFVQEEIAYKDLRCQIKEVLLEVIENLWPCVEEIRIKRWDLAVDVPYGRDCVQLIKDNRKYSQFYKSAQDFTEYLGSMSSPGRVKVYNKQLEAELDYPLTRIEVTLDSLDYIDCCRCWPNVYTRKVIDLAETKVMVQLLADQPVDKMDYYLRQMSAPTKRRYKALLLDRPFEIEGEIFSKLRKQLESYEKGVFI
nr:MAG TPA: REPLICATION INITIATION PROTEIN [Inoviridae sp.]